jgi:hypothetical protein
MNDLGFNERLRAINKLIGENAGREEVLAEAIKLKNDIRVAMLGVWPIVFALDNLVSVFAPTPDWQSGLWPEAPAATQAGNPPAVAGPPRYNRRTRTLEIAKDIRDKGGDRVKTEEIATRLQSEGDTSSVKDLAVAIGNILTRSDLWKWVGPGVYAPSEERKKKEQENERLPF